MLTSREMMHMECTSRAWCVPDRRWIVCGTALLFLWIHLLVSTLLRSTMCGTAEKFLSFKGCQLLANEYWLTPLCRVLQSAASPLLWQCCVFYEIRCVIIRNTIAWHWSRFIGRWIQSWHFISVYLKCTTQWSLYETPILIVTNSAFFIKCT